MLKLGMIKNAKGAHKNTKRLGRGASSGQGGTAGKGHKGQKARSGGHIRLGFEGGQMPLYRRLPKKGFSNAVFKKQYAIINLSDLDKLNYNEISLEILKDNKKIKTSYNMLKILGNGDIKKPIKVKAHAVSDSARQKIEKAGGSVEIIKS
jgi:large subunit ribosomal protein L15